ncbi:MAG: pyruvate dehydrogenase (acetyl-transferring) E1 component subunit alpha [Porphyromonadaceae bacterium]|nr:MAG: pyruvate dehydrogenase (acetyl-transferring) E1 component subunit alpha [Porphyromonadaceae bacterium]
MLKEFDATKKKMFRIMDDDGRIISDKHMPVIDDSQLVKAYHDMLFARTADHMTVSYQRQGRIFTYPPNYGQEAIHGATAQVIRTDDWLVPAFREMGAWLAKGATLKDTFLYFMGYEVGNSWPNANHFLPITVPIASQLPHAAGIGYAIKYKKLDEVVFAFVGDGGTSEGDFHEALNFAAVWKVPVIFVVQNNQFAISLPFRMQTASDGIAIKSLAYGMPGIQVDGNDFLAMLRTLQEATEFCRAGNGPVLIEAVTYRKGAHTTSDDPTKYRSKEEEESWERKDPLRRLRNYLVGKDLLDEEDEKRLEDQYRSEIDRIFVEAESQPAYPLEDVFKYMYAEMPDDLRKQQVEHEKFLQWKESNS